MELTRTQIQAPRHHQPPALGHTQVTATWHILNTGHEVFFGSTQLAVMGKAHSHKVQMDRKKMALEFQEEALSFSAVKRGGRH